MVLSKVQDQIKRDAFGGATAVGQLSVFVEARETTETACPRCMWLRRFGDVKP